MGVRSTRRWVSCARIGRTFVLATGLAVASVQVVAGSERTYELRGFVIDRSGTEIPYAVLTLEGTQQTVEADARGTFHFENIPRGTYSLSVRSSCDVTGYVPGLAIPRPIRVPLPVRATRFACDADGEAIGVDDQARLLSDSLHRVVRTGRHPLVAALLGDGGIRIEVHPVAAGPDRSPREITLSDGVPVPVHRVGVGGANGVPDHEPRSGAMVLRFCLLRTEADEVHVRMNRTTPAMDADIELLWAGEALLSYRRDETTDLGWRVAHQLFCLDDPALAPGRDGSAGSPSDPSDG